MRKRDPGHRGFRVFGGYPLGIFAVTTACGMVLFALLQPAPTGQAATFKWLLLLSWALVGLGLYVMRNKEQISSDLASDRAGP